MKTRLAAALFRCRVLSGVAIATLIGGALLIQAQPAGAQGGGNPFAALQAAVAALQSSDAAQNGQIAALHSSDTTQNANISALQSSDTTQNAQIAALQSTDTTQNANISALQTSDTTQNGQIAALLSTDTTQNGNISALQSSDTTQNAQIAALQDKTQFVSVTGAEMFITGTNLHIVNGLGTTGSTNGLGNLIVGYNEAQGGQFTDIRTGSHNIVAGLHNNYSSWGGIMGGEFNFISSRGEFVVGRSNTASGDFASISGGLSNTASGTFSSISGGQFNTADGSRSSISGGLDITQSNFTGWSAGSDAINSITGNFSSP